MAEAPKLWAHEAAQGLLTLGLLVWLGASAGLTHPATGMIAGVAAFQVVVLVALGRTDSVLLRKVRLASAYVVGLALFSAPRLVVPALGLSVRDELLLGLDRALWRETPAVLLAPFARP